MTKEIWKDVKGYEGYYIVSNLGTVVRLPRMRKWNGGITRMMPRKVLGSGGKVTYKTVVFNTGCNSRSICLHRLLALHFIPNENPNIWTYVNHIDGDIFNNDLSNLEWCTQSENIIHGKSKEKYSIRQKYAKNS